MLKYSVLISAYKKTLASEFKVSIDSMLKQTIFPDQIIVVWDGIVSSELRKMCDDYDKSFPNVFTFVKLSENVGLAAALNEGIKHSRNELIARMDTDDYSFPNRCALQIQKFMENDELALVGTAIRISNCVELNCGGRVCNFPDTMALIKKTITLNSAFAHPTVMFKKSIVESVGGYDSELKRSQDHDLFSRMIYNGFQCTNLNDVLLIYKADEQNIVRNKNKESCKARIIIQKRLFERKQCSLRDLLFVLFEVKIAEFVPDRLFKIVYKIVKRR